MIEAIGSLTIQRLKKGKNLVMGFVADKALFQGWNSITKTAEPDFTQAANRPTVTARVYASDGSTVVMSDTQSRWFWNSKSSPILFPEAWDGNTRISTDGNFKETRSADKSERSLTFLKNIATADNTASDTFYFEANGENDGINYTILGSFEFKIQTISSTGYALMTMGGNAITSENSKVKVEALLYVGGKKNTSKNIRWYNAAMTQIGTGYSIEVVADNVFGQGTDAGVYCMAFENNDDTAPLASTFHQINDFTDDYDVQTYVSGNYDRWDGSHPVVVAAKLYNVRTNDTLSASATVNWTYKLYDTNSLTPFITSSAQALAGDAEFSISLGSDVWSHVGANSGVRVTIEASYGG